MGIKCHMTTFYFSLSMCQLANKQVGRGKEVVESGIFSLSFPSLPPLAKPDLDRCLRRQEFLLAWLLLYLTRQTFSAIQI